jgi:hypothetical protein
MEHLPPVSKPFEPILVPYICDRDYDGLDFAAYPARRGFDIERVLKDNFQDTSSHEIASFLQTWLFFGLLHAVLGVTAETSDFVRTDEDGTRWIATEKLPGMLHNVQRVIEHEKALSEHSPAVIDARNDRISNSFRLAQDVWEGCSSLEERYSIPNPMYPEVSLGIQILATALHVGATQLLGGTSNTYPFRNIPWEKGRHFRLTQNPFLAKRMVSQDSCPVIIEQLRSSFSVLGRYYASLLGPRQRRLDHSECRKEAADCEAMKNFRPESIKHAVDGCKCKTLLVAKKRLADIISKDEIPVLRLVRDDGGPALDIVSSAAEP